MSKLDNPNARSFQVEFPDCLESRWEGSASPLARVIATLCAGRSRRDVIASIALTFAAGAVLWLSACIFLMIEPGI